MRIFFILLLTLSSICTQAKTDSRAVHICFERWWPYSFVNEQKQVRGIEVDIIKSALIGTPYRVTFHELPYRRCLAGVADGTFDFTLHVDEADGFPIIDVSFTTWLLSLAVKQGRFSNPDDFYQLAAPRVMISEDYSYPEAAVQGLKKINAAIVRRSFYEQNHDDGKKFFSVLNNNRVDAILVDKVWALEMIRRHQLEVTFLPRPFHAEQQFMGYNIANQTMARRIESLLERVPDKTIKAIEIKYLGDDF
ncbi:MULTISPECIES: transporter substrate-binding domain-containing protein [unclassified Pseudoalteromonas]|uniref:substrate-binding periplasmic protein n=1 Tax=unclassified Pseudoalteromonas TaxID=194690 RepID=UPI000C7CF07E|nr:MULTISPECIES: transporter substrate-binding domain-containing protein [unclassified Pseudoalteromonas]AUJ71872.1 cystine transporter subunit [Pseudoalteromonas sp. NC201]MBR8843411.1 transporter substrate-binding domain-containing protein [Pseudoalteromonas sp. JC3]MCG7554642.1 transporter substrate-binding domain-containing protein [Pseudoalteromonas sp. Of11M-6]WJE11354.1 transporter substrate-binding domain-containing protein [Pseudoalteromonas sp. JC3]